MKGVRLHFSALPLWFAMWLAIAGCAPAVPASVPSGPPIAIALQVGFFVPVLGTWVVDGFSESLREQLAEYEVQVVPARPSPEVTVVITLGDWSDRLGAGRSIGVALLRGMALAPAGRVWVPDLSMDTLNVAAEPVALLVARSLRAPPQPVQAKAWPIAPRL